MVRPTFDALLYNYVAICNENPTLSEIDCLWKAIIEVDVDFYFDVYLNQEELYEETSFFQLVKKLKRIW